MIYIITPYLSDVKKVCEENAIQCPIKDGKLLNSRIMWIHSLDQLFGIRILKTDKVYFGMGCQHFPADQYQRLFTEIEARKLYGK